MQVLRFSVKNFLNITLTGRIVLNFAEFNYKIGIQDLSVV
jgi:hypothetical protein